MRRRKGQMRRLTTWLEGQSEMGRHGIFHKVIRMETPLSFTRSAGTQQRDMMQGEWGGGGQQRGRKKGMWRRTDKDERSREDREKQGVVSKRRREERDYRKGGVVWLEMVARGVNDAS